MSASSDDLLTRVKENLRKLCGNDISDEELQSMAATVRSTGQKLLIHKPRRGTHLEHKLLHQHIKQQLIREATAAGVQLEAPIHPAAEAMDKIMTAEKWREVEYLTVTPNSFQALKQLPELQQLIAYTAAGVVRDVSGRQGGDQLALCSAFLEDAMCAPDFVLRSSSLNSLVQPLWGSSAHRAHMDACYASSLSLLLQCAPQLRLALAAEVAAGMLCPGQPAPPDTPEHGAALRIFTMHGQLSLQKELREHTTLAEAPSSNASSSSSSSKPRKLTQLQKLWAHTASTPQQQQRATQACVSSSSSSSVSVQAAAAEELLPPPSRVRSWALSPHIDLQLQVPPNLLLAVTVLAAIRDARRCIDLEQQEEQQQDAQAQQQQQQQQQQQGLDPGSVHDRVWQVLSERVGLQGAQDGTLDAVRTLLHEDAQMRLVVTLLKDAHRLNTAAAAGSSDSEGSSDGGDGGGSSSSAAAGAIEPTTPPARTAAPAGESNAATAAQAAAADVNPAAVIAAQAREHGELPETLRGAVSELAMRCLADLVTWGDQQQLPLQALQLLTAVRQLEATAMNAVSATCPAAAGDADHLGAKASAAAAAADAEQAGQRELMQQSLSLLQHVGTLNEQGLAASVQQQTAGCACASGGGRSSCNASHSSSRSRGGGGGDSGCSSCRVMPPCQFFAEDGPLSTCWGAIKPSEVFGLWHGAPGTGANEPAVDSSAAAEAAGRAGAANGAAAAEDYVAGRAAAAANGTAGQPFTGHQQQQHVLAVLQASAVSIDAQQHVSGQLSTVLQSKGAMQAFRYVLKATADTRLGPPCLCKQQTCELQRAAALLQRNGVALRSDTNSTLQLLGHTLISHQPFVSFIAHLRAAICSLTGLPDYDPLAWQRSACVGTLLERAQSSNEDSDDSDSDDYCLDDFTGRLAPTGAAGAAGSNGSANSSGHMQQADCSWSNSSSSSGYSAVDPRHWQSPTAVSVTEQMAQKLAHALPYEYQRQRLVKKAQIKQAASTLRQMASAAAAKLSPLQQWHQQHIQRQQEAAVQAHQWWGSKQRVATAIAAATGRTKLKQGSEGPTDSEAAAAATAAAATDEAGSNARQWSEGPCDYNSNCPVCMEELKQQQQQQQQQRRQGSPDHPNSSNGSSSGTGRSKNSSSSKGPYSSWPVPYDDPFLWRRLIWRLLGKVSPGAQAFYAQYLNMCPHCCDERNWECVTSSVERCLWSGPDLDVGNIVLTATEGLKSGDKSRMLRQFSRVINAAYLKSYHPSTVVVSKQVLLALSALHHQVLPPAEVAHLMPSSFTPSVGKALMQQLFEVPVLDGFEHQHCSLQLWHVWWHVGLRRYWWLQQLQQQRQSSLLGAGGSDSSSSTPADQLYLDADARLYAVGFASRLLAGESTERRRVSNNSSAVAQSMALQAAQRVLHNQAVDSIIADQLDRVNALKLRGSTNEYMSHVMEVVSNLFVVPNVLPAAEAVLTAVTLGPSDPLIPLQQQRDLRHVSCGPRSEGGKRTALLQVVTEMFYAPHYLRLACPHQHMLHQYRKAQRMAAGEGSPMQNHSQLQQQHGDTDMQQQQQQQDRKEKDEAVYMAAKCDAERLMLCDPVPAESLAGPQLWWAWHQELTGLMCCDVCSVYVDSTQQDRYTCADCEGPLYCSRVCYEGDKQHKTICDKLQAVRQRYTPAGTTTSSSSSSHATPAPGLQQPPKRQEVPEPSAVSAVPALPTISSLLRASQYEPGPLSQAPIADEDWPRTLGQLEEVYAELGRWVAED